MFPFTFSNPFALAAMASVGILYLNYRTQTRTSKKTTVPSLYFLKQITLQKRLKDKTKLPFRFYLEALILLLLSLYLADPSWEGFGAERIAIVLDTSQSMGAINSIEKSRLELAIEEIRNIGEHSNANFSLTTIPHMEKREEELGDALSLSFTSVDNLPLNKIQVSNLPDNMPESLARILPSIKANSVKKIIILSDKDIINSESATSSTINPAISTITIGSPENNTFVSGGRVARNNDGSIEMHLSLGFHGSGSTRIRIQVLGAGKFPGSIKDTGGQKLLAEHEVTLSGGSEVHEVIPLGLPKLKKQETAFIRVLISSNPVRDALESDNELFLTYSENSDNVISANFISSEIQLHQKEIKSLETALEGHVKALSLEDWKQQGSEKQSKAPLNIFYKVPVSTNLISENSLIILPTEGTDLIPIQGVSTNPKVTSWENNHPITRYLKLSLLSPARAIILGGSAWGKSIISVTDGPIISTGLHQGHSLVVSGIELLPFEGKNDRIASILLLNILSHLNGTNRSNDFKSATNPLTPGRYADIKRILPPENQSINQLGSSLGKGIYQGIGGDNMSNNIFSIPGYFKEESNTFTTSSVTISEVMESLPDAHKPTISWYLAVLACALLVIDLVMVAVLGREV